LPIEATNRAIAIGQHKVKWIRSRHMAHSESLAGRIRDVLAPRRGIEEKKMFGGVGFLLFGNMLVGVWKHSLVARLGPEEGQRALMEAHVREFDITGRPMRGWVLVDSEGVAEDHQLKKWIERSWKFVTSLPAKAEKPK
jgi:hypothetical protein